MTLLVLSLLLAQAPLTVPPSPASPDVTVPEAVAPGAEPADVKLFAQFVDRHLLAVSASGSSFGSASECFACRTTIFPRPSPWCRTLRCWPGWRTRTSCSRRGCR